MFVRVVVFFLTTMSFVAGCADGIHEDTIFIDVGADASTSIELVCGPNFCGVMVDKNTGITTDCGSCPNHTICGDNSIPNVCGSSCMPLTAVDSEGGTYLITPACDYAFGFGWGSAYGTEMQFPSSCNYTNPATCLPVDNQATQNKPCVDTVCGPWICCVDTPPEFPALLPGAVANNDGGLP